LLSTNKHDVFNIKNVHGETSRSLQPLLVLLPLGLLQFKQKKIHFLRQEIHVVLTMAVWHDLSQTIQCQSSLLKACWVLLLVRGSMFGPFLLLQRSFFLLLRSVLHLPVSFLFTFKGVFDMKIILGRHNAASPYRC